jgi:hypothetical protein
MEALVVVETVAAAAQGIRFAMAVALAEMLRSGGRASAAALGRWRLGA